VNHAAKILARFEVGYSNAKPDARRGWKESGRRARRA